MSVLLPAPFSPISASTSPARAISETSRNAVTPAKRLPMPAHLEQGRSGSAGSDWRFGGVHGRCSVGYDRFSSASLALKPATLLLSIKSTPVSMLCEGGMAAFAASPLVASSCIHLEAR